MWQMDQMCALSLIHYYRHLMRIGYILLPPQRQKALYEQIMEFCGVQEFSTHTAQPFPKPERVISKLLL